MNVVKSLDHKNYKEENHQRANKKIENDSSGQTNCGELYRNVAYIFKAVVKL